eukprot:308498-Amphidinium_carterae.2
MQKPHLGWLHFRASGHLVKCGAERGRCVENVGSSKRKLFRYTKNAATSDGVNGVFGGGFEAQPALLPKNCLASKVHEVANSILTNGPSMLSSKRDLQQTR